MNESQKKVSKCMNAKITRLKDGLENLKDHEHQPTKEGDIYNGMLKQSVQFEITHMEHLRDELIDTLGQ